MLQIKTNKVKRIITVIIVLIAKLFQYLCGRSTYKINTFFLLLFNPFHTQLNNHILMNKKKTPYCANQMKQKSH